MSIFSLRSGVILPNHFNTQIQLRAGETRCSLYPNPAWSDLRKCHGLASFEFVRRVQQDKIFTYSGERVQGTSSPQQRGLFDHKGKPFKLGETSYYGEGAVDRWLWAMLWAYSFHGFRPDSFAFGLVRRDGLILPLEERSGGTVPKPKEEPRVGQSWELLAVLEKIG